MRRAAPIRLGPHEEELLTRWAAEPAGRRAMRARILLEADAGRGNAEIARSLGVHTETVARWRNRFVVNRIDGILRGAPRSGGQMSPKADVVERILSITLDGHPESELQWSTRTLARTLGVNHMTVHRVWKAHGIVPTPRSLPPASARFAPWVDVVGLYLHPPAAAVIFAVEDRMVDAEPPEILLSKAAATVETRGRTSLVDSIRAAEELVPPFKATETAVPGFLVFLRTLEERSRRATQLNVVFDRPLELLPASVASWLGRHPRFRVYSTPSGATWGKIVDSWLRRWDQSSLHPSSFFEAPALADWMEHESASPSRRPLSISWQAGRDRRRADPPSDRSLRPKGSESRGAACRRTTS
ncbi:MAG TPA: helix-turn-helix domain-containing protein [Thermoplasmata archaeon]|nr:helix-turn-helix domain-containing protein [Thermoplasmata archaeon]